MYYALRNSKNRIAHDANCHYISHCNLKDLIVFQNRKELLDHGYTICNHCSIFNRQLKAESKDIQSFIKGKGIAYKVVDDRIIVKSKVDEWTIIEDCRKFHLYHKSKNIGNHDFRYIYAHHDQYIFNPRLMHLFKYIAKHDKYRLTEKTSIIINEPKPKNQTIKSAEKPDWWYHCKKRLPRESSRYNLIKKQHKKEYPMIEALRDKYRFVCQKNHEEIHIKYQKQKYQIIDPGNGSCLEAYYVQDENCKIYLGEENTIAKLLKIIIDYHYDTVYKTHRASAQEEREKLISEINLKTVYIDTPAPADKIVQMNNYDRVMDLFAMLEARRKEESILAGDTVG